MDSGRSEEMRPDTGMYKIFNFKDFELRYTVGIFSLKDKEFKVDTRFDKGTYIQEGDYLCAYDEQRTPTVYVITDKLDCPSTQLIKLKLVEFKH